VTVGRLLRALAVVAGLAAATSSLTWGLLFHRPLPTIDGHYRFLGLHERGEVVRDVFGIPRIYARDPHDLYLLQGYVTAQDRLAQMDALRTAAKATARDAAARGADQAAPALREALEAYAEGVNKFIAQHAEARALPGEVVLAGRRPEPWRPADTLAIVARYLAAIPPASVCASVAATATSKGRPLFAADLYLDAPAPGWHEVGLDGAATRALGVSLPGVPGIVAGHNGWIAWATLASSWRGSDPDRTLGALLDAPNARDLGRLGAAGATAAVTCVSERAGVVGGDGARGARLRGALERARGVDLETLRALLGRPAAPVGARILIDLADVDTSRSVVSQGASGHRSSPHFDDQVPLWEIGQVHRLPFTRGAIGRTDGALVLRAR
jgi:acyl-homoserine lactone acylase PvdQ